MTATVSETVAVKAARLLTSGSVSIVHRVDRDVIATVLGDTGRYEVVRRRGGWHCDCASYGRCSHLVAVLLVVGGER